jgi:hypothetical protein
VAAPNPAAAFCAPVVPWTWRRQNETWCPGLDGGRKSAGSAAAVCLPRRSLHEVLNRLACKIDEASRHLEFTVLIAQSLQFKAKGTAGK